jgi:hypothetical protein
MTAAPLREAPARQRSKNVICAVAPLEPSV